MNAFEFLASVIDSLAWPILVGFSIYTLRNPVGELLQRISKLKYGKLETEFRERLNDIKLIPGKSSGQIKIDKTSSTSIELEDLAEVSPRTAVLETWIAVEKATTTFCEANGLPSKYSFQGLFNIAKEKDLDIDHIRTAYQELRLLRNKAVHASEFEITPNTAKEYMSAANFIIAELGMREN